MELLREYGVGRYTAVQVVLYSTDNGGRPCIASWMYTTLDYYMDKTKSSARALELARSNPLALLEAGKVKAKPGSLAECTAAKPPRSGLRRVAPQVYTGTPHPQSRWHSPQKWKG